jgi:hypothetical protein
MQVILTPTAVADKFGVGLNGFADSVPGPPTALSEQWFDSVQMEIVNVIIGQGIALDGLVFDQLKQAIDDYAFVNPSVEAGGSLTISNGATLYLAPGSLFFADDTSSFSVNTADAEFLKDLLIGDSSGDALIVSSTSTFQSAVFFNDNVDIGTSIADTLTILSLIDAKVTIGATDNAAYLLNLSNLGTGGGLQSLTTGGYAGWFQTDTTSPVRTAIHLEPQDNDSSSPLQGDVYHHSTRGKLRQRHFSEWQSVHSSLRGYVFGYTAVADQAALIGTTGNVGGVVIEPEEVGNVMVTLSFFWVPAADTTTVTCIIRDNTVPVNLTSRIVRAKTAAAGARGETVTIRRVYTLPSTAQRTFVLNITTSAAADVQDIVLSVQGVT